MTTDITPGAVPATSKRNLWIIGGAIGLVSLATAGTMAVRSALPPPVDAPPPATANALAAPAGKAGKPVPERHAAAATHAPAAAAQPCANCGVIESVRSVTKKGQGTGVGAVAGGVVGGVLGNQVGKGNGRTAMTVLGAVGGGFAGNEVEKRARSVTVHEVRVRMDDGTLRTIEQAGTAQVGERVTVQGNVIKAAGAAATGNS
jgi:outer membrane lipoprotein SlyB